MAAQHEFLPMQEIQKVALEILKKVTAICERKNFRYTLAFGTLIGAIRHNGFIPWDDDIDIMMPRQDYEGLLAYLVNNPIEHLKVFNHKYVPKHPLGISRICDMRYKIEEPNFIDADMGIFIDIYPLDGLANTYEGAKKAFLHTEKSRADLLRLISKQSPKLHWQMLFTDFRYLVSAIKLRILGLSYIQQRLEREARSRDFNDYKYVGVPNWNWAQIVFQRDWFNDFMRIRFEDADFNIITQYDAMLREEYGDYMKLPPQEKRVYHHQYIAYKRI